MKTGSYDLIIVGGGLGGAALARAMAARGARVLVVEREHRFKDRVRGEWLAPWGLAEARELGIHDLLLSTCGHRLPGWDTYLMGMQVGARDFLESTPQRLPSLGLYHPALQEVLLQAAEDAGAQVQRGAAVRALTPGMPPRVVVEHDGSVSERSARLVAGADGRTSMVRTWGRFRVRRDPERVLICGVLFDDMTPPRQDAAHIAFHPSIGQAAYLFPQGAGRVRAYLVLPHDAPHRLQGDADVPRFIEECARTNFAPELYRGARAAGPLASFNAADTWVDHPYADGIALMGDAAASSDPTFGQGLSLTLRDVRVLRDCLLSDHDWDAAANAYAAAHDRHYGVLHAVNDWFAELFLATGPAADERRDRALIAAAQDPTRMPDHQFSGPDLPCDAHTYARLFGDD
ncbi:MAG TPA: FAD-dependent monooxygenase [Vicinamibacterales bacterium]|nr:FAD-dependent monooxygenase [Vicinamibacterales bacterium]